MDAIKAMAKPGDRPLPVQTSCHPCQTKRVGFTAEVHRNNQRMQAILNTSGYHVKSAMEGDVYSFKLDFD